MSMKMSITISQPPIAPSRSLHRSKACSSINMEKTSTSKFGREEHFFFQKPGWWNSLINVIFLSYEEKISALGYCFRLQKIKSKTACFFLNKLGEGKDFLKFKICFLVSCFELLSLFPLVVRSCVIYYHWC